MGAIIRTKGLRKDYFLGKVRVPVLRGVDFTLRRGEFVALTGASGSGKTTLLSQIGLLDVPTKGEIFVNETSVLAMSAKEQADTRLFTFGYVFQFFNLFGELTALENVFYPALFTNVSRSKAEKKAVELLHSVGLGSYQHHRPNELSGGQQQRVAVARALINDPEVIFADEPTGNLDSKNAEDIVRLLKRVHQTHNTAIFLITHELELAKTADRIITIRDGVLADGVADKTK